MKEISTSSVVSLLETLQRQESELARVQQELGRSRKLIAELIFSRAVTWPTEDETYIKAEDVLNGTHING